MFKLEEGWLTVALLCALIVVAAGGIAAAAWTDGLQAAWITGVVAVLAGLALARSRFAGGTAFLFATVYGLFTVGVFVSLGLEGDWHSRAIELVVRLNAFLYKVLHGGTSRDALPFPVSVALIFWYIGVLMAWSVFRRGSVWPALIPAGVGLLVNTYYYLGPARLDLYLAFYVLLALMFVARMNLLSREREWQSARVAYSTDLRLDFLRAGLVAALAGVLIGWAAPGLAASPAAATKWREMTGSLRVVRESWMRMFAAIRGYGQAYSDFYSDALTLGGPARLSGEPIMDVHINAVSGEDQVLDESEQIQRYYWRAAAYGDYIDGRWELGETTYSEFDPTDNASRVQSAPYAARRQVSLAFTMHVAATSRLYVAPQPLWFDRANTLELTFDPVGGAQTDIVGARAQEVLRRGEVYQMISAISIADEGSLQTAGQDYPAWVREGFLAVPPEVTARTRDLARQIVAEAGAENPYDMAVAITNWLRANITYDQNIDAPPPNVDPVDYVLFTSRRGYCNYYASAEVLMLRALGIPARLAVGFSQGALDENTSTYHVLEQNAHAWPEVFFPKYGWVEFEPTTSEAPLIRPAKAAGEDNRDPVDPNSDEGFESLRDNLEDLIPPEDLADPVAAPSTNAFVNWLQNLPWTAIGLSAVSLALAALVLGVFSVRVGVLGWESFGRLGAWALQRSGQPLPTGVALVYMQFERAARWLGLSGSPAVTPDERAAAFAQALPASASGVAVITTEYVTEQYSPRPANPASAQRAWRGIRWQVWHDTLRAYLLDLLEEKGE
ncbi:MAG: transglutaminase domain-containing protein [Anaerolineales bacterium]|nr:transglutaminase domain-containing protein [Anaerolineales bacterium]